MSHFVTLHLDFDDAREIEVHATVSRYWRGTLLDPPEPPEVLSVKAWWRHGGRRASPISSADLNALFPDLEDRILDAADDEDGEDGDFDACDLEVC